MIAIDADLARLLARIYVRRMVAKGYSVADAAREINMGRSSTYGVSYSISHGRISVPMLSREWVFSFAELAKTIDHPQQLSLL